MKKDYHYFFNDDDLNFNHPELFEFDSCFSHMENSFRDVVLYLDQQRFDVRNSVVNKLVEYAGQQFKDFY